MQVCSRKCAHANSARATRLCKCARGSVQVRLCSCECDGASAIVQAHRESVLVRLRSCKRARASVPVQVCSCEFAGDFFRSPSQCFRKKTCPSSSPVPNRSPHRSVSKGHNQNLAITSRVCPRTCRTLLNGISAPIYAKGGFPLLP